MSKKLFAEYSDDVVTKMVSSWRDMADEAAHYYEGYFDVGKNKGVNSKLFQSIDILLRRPHKNPRTELRRWRELYEQLQPSLRLVRRRACGGGRDIMDKATSLYNNEKSIKTITKYVHINVELAVWENSPYADDFNVSVTPKSSSLVVSGAAVKDYVY